MPQFLILFGADVASSICFGEVRAIIANAGLDADSLLPRIEWEVLDNPCLVLDFPSSEVALGILPNLFSAKSYYELLAMAPTLELAISQLQNVSSGPKSALFDVSE